MLSIDYNIHPGNPGQPAKSANLYILCAGFKINFAKLPTSCPILCNRVCSQIVLHLPSTMRMVERSLVIMNFIFSMSHTLPYVVEAGSEQCYSC